jgi:hypothetical protein
MILKTKTIKNGDGGKSANTNRISEDQTVVAGPLFSRRVDPNDDTLEFIYESLFRVMNNNPIHLNGRTWNHSFVHDSHLMI